MPAIRAEPWVGATKPVSSRIVVVLPAPLGPRKATTCPLGIENDTSRTARNDPNCLQSPSASIMTGVDMPVESSQALKVRRPQPRVPTPPISSRVRSRGTDPSIGHANVQECMACGPRIIFFYEDGRMCSLCAAPEFQRNRQDFESRAPWLRRPRWSANDSNRAVNVVTKFVQKVGLIVDMTRMALCNPRLARFSDTRTAGRGRHASLVAAFSQQ